MEAAPGRWSPRGSWSPTRRTTARSSGLRTVSPFGLTAHYRSPSVAVLPDGRVIVAFRNDTATGSTDRDGGLRSHQPRSTATTAGRRASRPSARAPCSATRRHPARERPRRRDDAERRRGRRTRHGRLARQVGGAVRAFAAMSTDNGATFGPAQQIDPARPGQSGRAAARRRRAERPRRRRVPVGCRRDGHRARDGGLRRASAGGRHDRGLGAARRRGGHRRQRDRTRSRIRPRSAAGSASRLPRRSGTSPLPATVVAFTDTSQSPGNQDVHVVGLLHGTTPPVIGAQTSNGLQERDDDRPPDGERSRRRPADVVGRRAADDRRARASTPPTPLAATSPSSRRTRRHRHVRGGRERRRATRRSQTISVNVVNDPPEITCQSLVTHEDTPLVDTGRRPASPIRTRIRSPSTLDSATGGTVQRVSGTWFFNPDAQEHRSGLVRHACHRRWRHAGRAACRVTVTIAANTAPVTLVVTNAGKPRVLTRGLALRLQRRRRRIRPASARPITWDFGDKTPPAQRRERRAPLPPAGHVHRDGDGRHGAARHDQGHWCASRRSSSSAPRASRTASCSCACARGSPGSSGSASTAARRRSPCRPA